MAEQSPQDVVKQAQSVDDLSSADVSVSKPTEPTVRVVPENKTSNLAFETDTIPSKLMPASKSEPEEESIQAVPTRLDANSPLEITASDSASDALQHQDYTPQVNGTTNKRELQESEIADEGSVRSIGVDGSVGSDTDASRADVGDNASKELVDGQEQTRPNALKKSATFKPVSVTKNFLAKAGTATVPNVKASNEKANGATGVSTGSLVQSIPRPRLVAKSASGQRNAVPKALNMAKPGKGSGPDPNQVWNRNRVSTPQATPKHLTDEELRQQYGIQLASRPQEDGDGKEAKWADIDDDEDDWAPETIEWNDGTKINLAQTEIALVSTEAEATPVTMSEKEIDPPAQKVPPVKPLTTVGPNATVLKLGSPALPKIGGLVLKTPSDKPTLVAKVSASNQVKSPWALLPPVEKISPIPINPSSQHLPARFGQKDTHGFDAMPPPPLQAKEIAADDFSRSSRETPGSTPRELFNSQSGRYEPVNENRRGSSVRKDQNFRAPSLLQRPSLGDQRGPAEPSAAFQTSRSGQQDIGTWNRRRASSNVSGESGNLDRRMSLGKGFDPIHQQRADSQIDQSPLTPGILSARFGRDVSPAQSHGQSITSQSPTAPVFQNVSVNGSVTTSPQQSQVQPVVTPSATILPDVQGSIALQTQLMREKRQAAIKRRQEDEAREEAAKRERIRLKLEKMGFEDGKSGKKEIAPMASEAIPVPIDQEKELEEPVSSTPRSPPKPPVPSATGEPQQYGLMKVHAPQPANAVLTVHGAQVTKAVEAIRMNAEILPSKAVMKSTSQPEESKPYINGNMNEKTREVRISVPSENRHDDSTIEHRQHNWKAAPPVPNGQSNWNSGMTTHSSPGANLWGPPSNHRALGNGDFQQSVQRPQSMQPPYQAQTIVSPPQPIGPPRPAQQLRIVQPLNKGLDPTARIIVEDSQTIPAFPPPETVPILAQNHTQQASEYQTPLIKASVGPTVLDSLKRLPQASEPTKSAVNAWTNFGTTTVKHDAERNEKLRREHEALVAEEKRTGNKHDVSLPTMNETWRKTKTIDGQRYVVETVRVQNQLAPQPDQSRSGDFGGEMVPKPSHLTPVPPQVRSRYQDIFEQNQRAVSLPISPSRSHSTSPPPPESETHPAHFTANQRPLVNLPGSKPKSTMPRPTVRLPPPATSAKPPQIAPEMRITLSRTLSQPLVANPSWQDRFNGLFDRKSSPEKKFADVVDFSSSKMPFDLVSINHPAAVALPPQDEVLQPNIYRTFIEIPTKNVEDEDALFEERDFGSVPTIRIPDKAPEQAWTPARPPKPYRGRIFNVFRDHDILSVVDSRLFGDTFRSNGIIITVRIGSMSGPVTKIISRNNGHNSHRSQQLNSPKNKPRHPNKSREVSSVHSQSKTTNNSSVRAPIQTGQPQQARPKINNTNLSWARRASGVVQ